MSGSHRSAQPEVRNPVLALPEMAELRRVIDRHPDVKAAHLALLQALQRDALAKGNRCWGRHKAPMAAYWKGFSVYFGHIRRALRTPILTAPEAAK